MQTNRLGVPLQQLPCEFDVNFATRARIDSLFLFSEPFNDTHLVQPVEIYSAYIAIAASIDTEEARWIPRLSLSGCNDNKRL